MNFNSSKEKKFQVALSTPKYQVCLQKTPLTQFFSTATVRDRNSSFGGTSKPSEYGVIEQKSGRRNKFSPSFSTGKTLLELYENYSSNKTTPNPQMNIIGSGEKKLSMLSPSVLPPLKNKTPKKNGANNNNKRYSRNYDTPQLKVTKKGTPSVLNSNSCAYVAIAELRNRKEIGIAAMNLNSAELILYEFNDDNTFSNTITTIHLLSPQDVLISDSMSGGPLFRAVQEEFPFCRIKELRRKYFDENRGLDMIEKYGSPSAIASVKLDSSKYLCLAATACLFQYIDFAVNVTFASKTLRVILRNIEGYMKMDLNTISNLALINLGKCSRFNSTKDCLRQTILLNKNEFFEERMLRQNIIQPLADLDTIETRQACVTEILESESLFWELQNLLHNLPDLDKINAKIVQVPKQQSPQDAENTLSDVLKLKKILEVVPNIADSLNKYTQGELFSVIAQNMKGNFCNELKKQIYEHINTEANDVRKSEKQKHRGSLVFSVRSKLNGMLDIARATFYEVIEDINTLGEKYKEEFQIPSLRLEYSKNRGYHLSFPTTFLEMPDFPEAITQKSVKGKRCYCSTDELTSLHDRQQEAYTEVIFMSQRVIEHLLEEIRKQMGSLCILAESLALLDMLASFACLVTLNENYVRPKFSLDGPIAIRNGRHPIIEKLLDQESIVPNDIYLGEASSMHVVTGPNNSGKSTYLQQTGLLLVMAHIGSYVPATWASFRVTDALLTKLSFNDNFKTNSGAMLVELREVSYILENISNNSIVLIDELGRGTSHIEGVGIVWSVCEKLLKTSSYTILATHFIELKELSIVYPSVKNVRFSGTVDQGTLKFNFKLREGFQEEEHEMYGIKLAELAAFPEAMIEDAKFIYKKLKQNSEALEATSSFKNSKNTQQLLIKLLSLKFSSLPLIQIANILKDMQGNFKDIEF